MLAADEAESALQVGIIWKNGSRLLLTTVLEK